MKSLIIDKDNRIIARSVPVEGDEVYVETLGKAKVLRLYHTVYDNFIVLLLLETILGEYEITHRITVNEYQV